MAKKVALCLLAVCVMFAATSAYAFEASPWTNAGSSDSEQARAKMEFGLKNFFLGWTEIFQEPYQAYKNGDSDVFTGLLRGLYQGVYDTAGGLVHLGTFPCPHIDVPLPEGGTDIG